MTVLSADRLRVRATGGPVLLDDVSLSVDAGETLLVCGPPGCGKTLLAKSLRGLLDDRADLEVSGAVQRPGSIGFVFQRPAAQLVRRVVRDDVAFGLENRGLPVEEIEARIERYAASLDAEGLLDRPVRDLSGGETALVAILGSLVTEPDVLVLDEPVATLDYPNTTLVLDAIDRLIATGTAVVIAEHDLRDLLGRADEVLLLASGNEVAHGPPRSLLPALVDAGVKLPFATEAALALGATADDVPLSTEEDAP